MSKQGKRFAPRRKKIKSDQTPQSSINGDTREFAVVTRRPAASYFFFTLFICFLLAFLAAAVLSVDYFGRAMSDGAEFTLAFNVSQDGQAHLSFLGRDYNADISFLAPVKDFLGKGASAAGEALPESLRFVFGAIPELYRGAASLAATVEKYIFELISSLL